MKVTIEIEVSNKGTIAVADEVHALVPNRKILGKYITDIVPAVLPVKFRVVDNQTQSSYITFSD